MRTLLDFAGFFGGGDFFLQFLLQGFLEEVMSFGTDEGAEVVKSSTMFGGVHDEVACVEKGIEFFVDQGTNLGGIGRQQHTVRAVKNDPFTKVVHRVLNDIDYVSHKGTKDTKGFAA